MYSRLHHMRIYRSRERPSSANGWPRCQCRWQISHCGGAPQPRHYTLHYRVAGFARYERAE